MSQSVRLDDRVLNFTNGKGWVISGEQPEESDDKVREELDDPELLAVSTLGRLAKNPRVAALRRFITNWYVSNLAVDDTRLGGAVVVAQVGPEAGPAGGLDARRHRGVARAHHGGGAQPERSRGAGVHRVGRSLHPLRRGQPFVSGSS